MKFGPSVLYIAVAFVLVVFMSRGCPSWCYQRHSHVGRFGFLDGGNVDVVAVEKNQQFSHFAADMFSFHCISRKQLVGVGIVGVVSLVQGSIRYCRRTEAIVEGALPASAAPQQKMRFNEWRRFESFGCRQCQ